MKNPINLNKMSHYLLVITEVSKDSDVLSILKGREFEKVLELVHIHMAGYLIKLKARIWFLILSVTSPILSVTKFIKTMICLLFKVFSYN